MLDNRFPAQSAFFRDQTVSGARTIIDQFLPGG
jgi:hypothetical protein